MNGQTHGGVRDKVEQLHDFFSRRLWDTRLDQLPPRDARRYRSLRVLSCTVRGLLFSKELSLCAAALTYYTVLSLVPLLAFGFAVLKGFGTYDALIEKMVRPYVLETFGANPALRRAIEQVMDFVDETKAASLGFVGLLLLLFAATRVLRHMETAFNDIWDARAARAPLKQFTQYVAIIVVTPTCLLAAAAVGTVAQSIEAFGRLQNTLGISAVLWTIARLAPLVIVFIGLVFLYKVMPNTQVRVRSAAIGAVFGAVLWYTALVLHVRFQVGVASFNALYSGFAALPIFLVWLDVSWLAVLVGAEIAATHQHERARAQRRRAAEASHELREALCLSALLRLMRAAFDGTPQPTLRELSLELDAPEPLLYAGLQRLAGAGLVVNKAGSETDPHWVLGRAPEHIHVKDVLDALRGGDGMDLQVWPGLHPGAVNALVQLECELERTPAANRSLRELVADH